MLCGLFTFSLRINDHDNLLAGGRIDHAHHEVNAKRALVETLALEQAVQRALDITNSEDTLIVVTADHSHTLTIGSYPSRGNDILGLFCLVPRNYYNLKLYHHKS